MKTSRRTKKGVKALIFPALAGLLALALLAGCQTTGMGGKPAIADLGNGVYEVPSSGLMWQANRSEETFGTFAEAQRYAASLDLGGYADWRLPTIYELYDFYLIFDLNQGGSCVIDMGGNFWSGEKDGDGIVGAWEIGDQCDPERLYYEKETNPGYVRAVRP